MPEEEQNQQPTFGNPEEIQGVPTGQAAEKPKIVGLHTLKSDATAYLKEKDMSLVDIAAEISKQRRFDEETTETNKTLLVAGAIILLVVGLGIGGWLFFKNRGTAPQTPLFEPPNPLILAEKRETINLKSERRSELVTLVQNTLNSPITLNTILYAPIFLETTEKKEFLTAQRFLEILKIIPPPNLTQSLEGAFMLGVFYLKKNSPFLIFKINSFDLALSGTLSWEKNIAKDLKEIMRIQNIPAVNQKFQDKIIKNHDARVLYDVSGNLILIYAFVGKNYLVITNDFDTFEEILRRFTIARQPLNLLY